MGVLAYLVCWLVYGVTFLSVIPAAIAVETPSSAHHTLPTTSASTSSQGQDDIIIQGAAQPGQEPTANVQPAQTLTDYLWVALVTIGLSCSIFAAYRHAQLYRRSPSTAGMAVLCGIVLFGEALLTQMVSDTYTLSFWLYHVEEFVGFAVISYAGLVAYRQGQSQVGLFESLFLIPTRARIQADYTQGMAHLVEILARGEEPTLAQQHYLRAHFGMTETQMRVLERAASAVAHERRQRQELERLNAVLHQLEQNKEQLMQMVVHDLKNPLTALIGFLDILRMDYEQLSIDQQQLLDGALRSGKTLWPDQRSARHRADRGWPARSRSTGRLCLARCWPTVPTR